MKTHWPIVELGEIIERLDAGVSVSGSDTPAVGTDEYGVLKVSCLNRGRFKPEENKRVEGRELARLAVSPRKGDIIISRANTFDLVGASAYVDEDCPNLFLPDKLWRVSIRDPTSVSPRWLIELLNSDYFRKEFRRRATGTSGSMKNLSKKSLLGIHVPKPSVATQKQIGETFEVLNQLVLYLGQLKIAKMVHTRGLMQQLLTGLRRFPEFVRSDKQQPGEFGTLPKDWRVVPIGKIAAEAKQRGTIAGAEVYSCTKHEGLVLSKEYFGKQVFSRNLESYKRVEIGDFAYATNHIEEGSIGLLRPGNPVGLVSPMYTVFRPHNEINPEFLFSVLKTENYRRIFQKRTNASVNRRGSLRWSEFSKIRVPIPTRPEQDRIAEALALAQQEIDLLVRQRQLYDDYKKGLLSRLLSGELELPTP